MLDKLALAPAPPLDDRLFDKLSVYQDVVVAGQTVRRGIKLSDQLEMAPRGIRRGSGRVLHWVAGSAPPLFVA